MIARVEYPRLDAGPYLDQLDALGREARLRVESAPTPSDAPFNVDPDRYARVVALNKYLFSELQFVGNEIHLQDPRNSFLNEVLDRRTGIPITLALLYWRSPAGGPARRRGQFSRTFPASVPGPSGPSARRGSHHRPFHGGALVSENGCRELLRKHAGAEAEFGAHTDGARDASRRFCRACC